MSVARANAVQVVAVTVNRRFAEVGANLAQPSMEEQKLYNRLVLRAKHLALDGYLPEALSLYRRALAIYAAPSLQRKIDRIEVLRCRADLCARSTRGPSVVEAARVLVFFMKGRA